VLLAPPVDLADADQMYETAGTTQAPRYSIWK
jgi:hypothetical protein